MKDLETNPLFDPKAFSVTCRRLSHLINRGINCQREPADIAAEGPEFLKLHRIELIAFNDLSVLSSTV